MEPELSPSERYAAAKRQSKFRELGVFAEQLKFALDDFQLKACQALEFGHGVLVAAPTGAGKTVVGEFAIHLAVSRNQKVFYTTPIKALSNQKFAELASRYGKDRVGLLTGDTNQNSTAQIVVMTTEVLRNMIYANSEALIRLGFVVMDEVHYLADRFRGAVWEEVILHLPKDVKVVSLSATVSNAEEFGAWLAEVRGDTSIIVSEHRPVPLHQHVLFQDEFIELFDPTSAGTQVNPELVRRHGAAQRRVAPRTRSKGAHYGPKLNDNRIQKLDKPEVIEELRDAGLLPAIYFVFSRAGCENAVAACNRNRLRLTTPEEQVEIRRIAEARCVGIADEDLDSLGFFEWVAALERGYAAHHAGMLPAFKEVVEELFLRKLVKAVFATETLALGINMPAKTVVLDRLDKYNGEGRVQITAGEYTQLTGRAGRRGIDAEGHSVVVWSGQLDPNIVAGLASKRTYPLNSSFRPTYNMCVNLVHAFGAQRAMSVLEQSFAQFQADRSVVGLARSISEKKQSMFGYEKAMACHLGDFKSYAELRAQIGELEKETARFNRGRRGEDIRQTKGARRREQELAELKRRLRQHPCHGCAEREAHSRWGERWNRLNREVTATENQIEARTNQVARTFERISQLLVEIGYLDQRADGDLEVSLAGQRLAKIYGERDLLIARVIEFGVWRDLDAASLASMAMALVYEGRRDEQEFEPKLPKGNFREALLTTEELQEDLSELQLKHKLTREQPLELGLCWATYRWASGARFDDVLKLSGLLPGDFIRWNKQLIDLLEQLSKSADSKVAETAYRAIDLVKRGIVEYSYYG